MAIPLIVREQAFNSADFHVQVAIQEMPEKLNKGYGTIHVVGSIARVFKAKARLEIHDVVEFDVPVVQANAAEKPDGGMFCRFEDLFESRNIEVSLNGDPPFLNLASDLFEVVEEPSDHPVLVFQNPR